MSLWPLSLPHLSTHRLLACTRTGVHISKVISIRSVIRTPCPNEVNLNGWIQFRHQSFVAKTSAMTVQPNTTTEDVCRYKIRVIAYHITYYLFLQLLGTDWSQPLVQAQIPFGQYFQGRRSLRVWSTQQRTAKSGRLKDYHRLLCACAISY